MGKALQILFFLLCTLPLVARAELVDRIVAVVNNDTISLSELNEEGSPIFAQIIAKAPKEEQEAALRKARAEVLAQLIDKLLIRQKAAQLELTVSKAEIDTALENILANNKIGRDKFQQELKRMGTTEERYQANLKDQILRSKVVGNEVKSKLVITEEKVKEYYRDSYAKENGSEGYHLLQIGFAWGEKGSSETKAEARKKAEQIREMIIAGEDFKQTAAAYSDLPSAADGGDLGTFKAEDMAAYMRDAVLPLPPGELSPVVETPVGFQFFKLISRRINGVLTQAPVESVQKEIRELLFQKEMQDHYETWIKELRGKALIKQNL